MRGEGSPKGGTKISARCIPGDTAGTETRQREGGREGRKGKREGSRWDVGRDSVAIRFWLLAKWRYSEILMNERLRQENARFSADADRRRARGEHCDFRERFAHRDYYRSPRDDAMTRRKEKKQAALCSTFAAGG